MRSTFKVLFYLKRNATKKNGLASVMCRITVNGKIAQCSCKLDVEEKSWSVEFGRGPVAAWWRRRTTGCWIKSVWVSIRPTGRSPTGITM